MIRKYFIEVFKCAAMKLSKSYESKFKILRHMIYVYDMSDHHHGYLNLNCNLVSLDA